MKLVKAYIREDVLEDVYVAMRNEGFNCVTVTQVEGTGSHRIPEHEHSSMVFPANHTEIIKLELVCRAERVEPLIELIRRNAYTGYEGDGIIYVSPVERAVPIGNEEPETYINEPDSEA